MLYRSHSNFVVKSVVNWYAKSSSHHLRLLQYPARYIYKLIQKGESGIRRKKFAKFRFRQILFSTSSPNANYNVQVTQKYCKERSTNSAENVALFHSEQNCNNQLYLGP